MREIILYSIAALSSLFVLGYSVHMLIGGLVSERTETIAIVGTCLAGAAAIGYMAWDVIQHRKGGRR